VAVLLAIPLISDFGVFYGPCEGHVSTREQDIAFKPLHSHQIHVPQDSGIYVRKFVKAENDLQVDTMLCQGIMIILLQKGCVR
jgi:hypothetical protein